MRKEPIRRISSDHVIQIAEYFQGGPALPAIITGAVESWPATAKWNLDFFASNFRQDFGIALFDFFDASSGKATKLGAFIDHLDEPLSAVPGLWIGHDGKPARSAPEYDDSTLWGFKWDPFRRHPELYSDIRPYPAPIPNRIAHLALLDLEALQNFLHVDLHSIYITRKGTVTPLHRDFNHTIGSLVQFQSRKAVYLFAPRDYQETDGAPFDPERPDYDRFETMRDATAYSEVIAPGEMLIIPPDWWHYTKNHDHSVTLSHNFINRHNYPDFMTCLAEEGQGPPERQVRFEAIRRALEQARDFADASERAAR